MECYNISGEPVDDDPRDIHILESEGSRALEGPDISFDKFLKMLKIKKVNIGSPKNPKFQILAIIGMMRTVEKIIDLLHEFQDLFLIKFFEMKGIFWYLGEMKIGLKLEANLVKQIPYWLNPRYKEKVKE